MGLEVIETAAKKPIPEALTMKELAGLGPLYEEPRDRALFYFCYLTGARISEALDAMPDDVKEHSSPELGRYLTVRLLTRKNKRVRFRDVPVPTRQQENVMVSYLKAYIQAEAKDRIFPWLTRTNAWYRLTKVRVNVRAIRGREILPKFQKKINPHYLRHCRLTHLVQHYGFNELQLMRFAGWTNTRPAIVYLHLNWMDLAKVMSQAGGEGWTW